MLKPSTKIKIEGNEYPVFRSPVTEDMIQECLISGKSNVFFIHDMKSGKMKKYDFTGKMPTRQTLDFNVSYSTIIKCGFGVLVASYIYKMLTFSPYANFKRKNAQWVKDFERNRKKTGVRKGSMKSPENGSGVMPNGWTVEGEANA